MKFLVFFLILWFYIISDKYHRLYLIVFFLLKLTISKVLVIGIIAEKLVHPLYIPNLAKQKENLDKLLNADNIYFNKAPFVDFGFVKDCIQCHLKQTFPIPS